MPTRLMPRDCIPTASTNWDYPGWTARCNAALAEANPANPIQAYYVHWDMLSLLQDRTAFVLPSALGYRVPLDGPYDTELTLIHVVEFFSGPFQPVVEIGGAYFLAASHLHPAILYGLLNAGGVYGYSEWY
jgi:hypothetical protein